MFQNAQNGPRGFTLTLKFEDGRRSFHNITDDVTIQGLRAEGLKQGKQYFHVSRSNYNFTFAARWIALL